MSETEVKDEGCACGNDGECKCGHIEGGCCKDKKVTRIDEKRARDYEERIRRWLNKHEGKTREEAIHALHQEDVGRMPLDQKFKQLEKLTFGAINQIASDLQTVERNQFELADAMDVNFRAFVKMMTKLGLSAEDHKACIEEALKEAEEERKAALEARKKLVEEQRRKAIESQEKQVMVSEAKEVAAAPGTEAAGAELPKDATVFGG